MAFPTASPTSPEQQVLKQLDKLSRTARLVAALFLVAILLSVSAVLVRHLGLGSKGLPEPSLEKWQAVFLTNGQVYFGHLKALKSKYYLLNEIYYTQTDTTPPPGATVISTSQPNLYLVKLAGEVHGPEDAMYIPSDRILFWENLREDSQVVRTIEKIQR